MKKIISLLLVLVMCAALFAGCASEEAPATTAPTETPTTAPTEADTTALTNAKEYLYTMYKAENGGATSTDYTVVSNVSVGSETYAIVWTIEAVSGDASCVAVQTGDTMTTITIGTNDTGAEIQYNLVATLTDANGNTESVSFKHTVPAVEASIADGTYVISANGLSLAALDATYNYGYASANTVTATDYSGVDVVTITNVNGGVTLQDCYGRYIYLKGTYNSFNVSTEAPTEGHVWEIVNEGSSTYLVNTMNGKTLAYSTQFTSWGAYEELTDDHTSALTITAAESKDVAAPQPEEPVETTPPTENNSGSTASVADGAKIVLYNAANDVYVTGSSYLYVNSNTGKEKYELEMDAAASSAVVLTVKVDGDTVSFVTDDGKYLFADGTNVSLEDKADEYTKFVLEETDGGYFIKCATATYYDKPQYLEIYSGYLTVYSMNAANAGIYTFELISAN